MKLSDILGSCVCSVYEGKKLGYILGVTFFDGYKKILGFIVVNDDDDYEYFLPTKQIIGQDKNMIFIKNETSITQNTEYEHCSLINKNAFYIDGKFIGKIIDVELDKNFETKKVLFEKLTLSPDKLFNVGLDFCFFCNDDKKPKLCRYAPTKQPCVSNMSVKIMQIETPTKTKLPQKIHAYDSLSAIGKIATQTVFGKNNELIIKKGEIVTLNTIKTAKMHNVYLNF